MSGTSEFAEEAHRQSARVAAATTAGEDQAWVDHISKFNDEDFEDTAHLFRSQANAHRPLEAADALDAGHGAHHELDTTPAPAPDRTRTLTDILNEMRDEQRY
jgi:hypothetical protein